MYGRHTVYDTKYRMNEKNPYTITIIVIITDIVHPSTILVSQLYIVYDCIHSDKIYIKL